MLIYIHIINSPYVISYDYQPDHLGHFQHLESVKQKLLATNLYTLDDINARFLPHLNLNPRLDDLQLLEQNIQIGRAHV